MKNPSYCTLYVVRHGETEWNTIGRIQGQLDSPLTDKGKKQAIKLSREFGGISFDAIFSSDLLRAKRTAEIVNLERKLKIQTTKALRERTFGEHDGSMGNEYDKKIKNLLKKYNELSEKEKWKFRFGVSYESDEELVSRFITFLREISVGYQGKTVLVVTHGGNIRTFLTRLGYVKYGELIPGTFQNSGYLKVESDGVDFFIKDVKGIDLSRGVKTTTSL